MSGFTAMVEASQKGTQRNMDVPNLEEERRKNQYPEKCSSDCPHHQCPYHNEQHYGQPCEMQWSPKRTKEKQSLPLERQIEQAIERAFKPVRERIEKIERDILNAPDYHSPASTNSPTFNGQRLRTDQGTNWERIRHD